MEILLVAIGVLMFIGWIYSTIDEAKQKADIQKAKDLIEENQGLFDKIVKIEKKFHQLPKDNGFQDQERYIKDEVSTTILMSQCPTCNKPLMYRKGMYGEFVGCAGYPKCHFTTTTKKVKQVKKIREVNPIFEEKFKEDLFNAYKI